MLPVRHRRSRPYQLPSHQSQSTANTPATRAPRRHPRNPLEWSYHQESKVDLNDLIIFGSLSLKPHHLFLILSMKAISYLLTYFPLSFMQRITDQVWIILSLLRRPLPICWKDSASIVEVKSRPTCCNPLTVAEGKKVTIGSGLTPPK